MGFDSGDKILKRGHRKKKAFGNAEINHGYFT